MYFLLSADCFSQALIPLGLGINTNYLWTAAATTFSGVSLSTALRAKSNVWVAASQPSDTYANAVVATFKAFCPEPDSLVGTNTQELISAASALYARIT